MRASTFRSVHVMYANRPSSKLMMIADLISVIHQTSDTGDLDRVLERDGTFINLEGRLQRLRRAAIPPAPDELAWISRLAERFGVAVSPYASQVFAEVSAIAFGHIPYGEVGERAQLHERVEAPAEATLQQSVARSNGHGLRLLRYRPLMAGPAVERVHELEFQRPQPEVELSPDDATRLGIETGVDVAVRSNGTSISLRARINKNLAAGVVRVAQEHAGELDSTVEVSRV